MGTNYYLNFNKKIAKHLGTSQLHIGTSSVGWRFTFHKIPNLAETVTAWIHLTKQGTIVDEYGRNHSFSWFWELVDNKSHDSHQSHCELVNGNDFLEGEFS